MEKVTKKIEFQYRPDGDLDEYFSNEDAERIVNEYRKLRYNQRREFYFFIGKNIFGYEYKLIQVTNRNVHYFTFLGENDHEKYKVIDAWEGEEENQDKKYKLFDDFLSTRAWEIEYEIEENGKLSIFKKAEKIRVVLSNELISSKKDMSSGVWNGVSSDMYRGFITYEDLEIEPIELLASNITYDECFGDILKRNNMSFSEKEVRFISGLRVTTQSIYTYEKEGETRFAYEYCMRTDIDSFACFSYIFNSEPTEMNIKSIIKNEKENNIR